MAKRRTKQEKIHAHRQMMTESVSASTFKKTDLTPGPISAKLDVTALLMSRPEQIKADLLKTVAVIVICSVVLAVWYWRLKIANF